MTKTKGLILVGILLLILGLVSCSDDENLKPITLKDDGDRTTITMLYPSAASEYSYSLQGGDGSYSVQSGNNEIVTAKMISPIDFNLKAICIGETTIKITDNSQNTLILNVRVNYETHSFVIKAHDVTITGDDLTENEKKAIREKQLAEIPVKVSGRYEFVYTDPVNGKGNAFIYPHISDSKRIETTFEIKEVENEHNPGTTVRGYELVINNEKRFFVLDRYYPSTKSDMRVPMALVEDVTFKVQIEYPKAEMVFTSQVIEMEAN